MCVIHTSSQRGFEGFGHPPWKPISTIKLPIQTEVWLLNSKKQDFLRWKKCQYMATLVDYRILQQNPRPPAVKVASRGDRKPLWKFLAMGMLLKWKKSYLKNLANQRISKVAGYRCFSKNARILKRICSHDSWKISIVICASYLCFLQKHLCESLVS